MLLPSELPIVQAPMAGGPSTPELAAAVSAAGGYSFLAAGYLSAAGLADTIAATRVLTGAAFGVNLFVPSIPSDPAPVAEYATLLQPEADRLGVPLGEPRWDDDDYPAKLELLVKDPVDAVSFTFGCPEPEVLERLHRAGSRVAVTVTSSDEAALAAAAGADLLLVQGTEAGGHQGSFLATDRPQLTPLLELLTELRETVDLPLIGTGGIMTGLDAATVLASGAMAVQLGTALLGAPESGSSPVYRQALRASRYSETIVTRAYSGRYARGLANRFALEHHAQAPRAYPEVHQLTRPLRAAATRAGDDSVPNLWAGIGWRQLRFEPAGRIISRIAAEARS